MYFHMGRTKTALCGLIKLRARHVLQCLSNKSVWSLYLDNLNEKSNKKFSTLFNGNSVLLICHDLYPCFQLEVSLHILQVSTYSSLSPLTLQWKSFQFFHFDIILKLLVLQNYLTNTLLFVCETPIVFDP